MQDWSILCQKPGNLPSRMRSQVSQPALVSWAVERGPL